MWGGNWFKSAWNEAKEAGRAAASAVATAADAAGDAVAAAASATAEATRWAARQTAQAAEWTKNQAVAGVKAAAAGAVTAGKAVAHAALTGAKWAAQQTVKAAKWAKEEAVAGARMAVAAAVATAKVAGRLLSTVVRDTYDAAKAAFALTKKGLAFLACAAVKLAELTHPLETALWDYSVAGLGRLGAGWITLPENANRKSKLIEMLDRATHVDDQKVFDGNKVVNGCQPSDTPPGAADQGFRPKKCADRSKRLPKITLVNGINTKLKVGPNESGFCNTMQKLADTACAEVVGVYNATEGMGKDLEECVDNIAKSSTAKATATLHDALLQNLRAPNPDPTILYAHSQGGLITQEALASVKQSLRLEGMPEDEIDRRMGTITVRTFGTAEVGWPNGPRYEHTNNTCDPVPHVIAGAQKNYPSETLSDNDPTPTSHFTEPHLNPIECHSIDDVYIPRIRKEPVGPRDCNCE